MVAYDSRRDADSRRYSSRLSRDRKSPVRKPSYGTSKSSNKRKDISNIDTPNGSVLPPVDRENTCPMLVRVFFTENKQLNIQDLNENKFPDEEFHIYTWKDATLKELANLIRDQIPRSRIRGAYFDITAYFPDFRRNSWSLKKLGSSSFGMQPNNDLITLRSRRFQVGDILHVDIITPKQSTKRI